LSSAGAKEGAEGFQKESKDPKPAPSGRAYAYYH